MIQQIIHWFSQYQAILALLGILSLLMFLFSLLALPWLIKLIPADYFQRPQPVNQVNTLFSVRNLPRNLTGFFIVLAGLAMFVLPGQGILTVLAGLAIMKFPGKHQLERWIISQKGVLTAVNWLRRKTQTPEIKL